MFSHLTRAVFLDSPFCHPTRSGSAAGRVSALEERAGRRGWTRHLRHSWLMMENRSLTHSRLVPDDGSRPGARVSDAVAGSTPRTIWRRFPGLPFPGPDHSYQVAQGRVRRRRNDGWLAPATSTPSATTRTGSGFLVRPCRMDDFIGPSSILSERPNRSISTPGRPSHLETFEHRRCLRLGRLAQRSARPLYYSDLPFSRSGRKASCISALIAGSIRRARATCRRWLVDGQYAQEATGMHDDHPWRHPQRGELMHDVYEAVTRSRNGTKPSFSSLRRVGRIFAMCRPNRLDPPITRAAGDVHGRWASGAGIARAPGAEARCTAGVHHTSVLA